MHRNADGILQAVHHRPFAHDLRNRHGPSATADMIVGGGGGMSNPFSRGGWIASLIGTAASRTPADARTQVTIGAAAGAYVDGIAAARAAGFSYAGSNLGGRTAFAVVAAGFAANFTYRWADGKATQYCEGYCGR